MNAQNKAPCAAWAEKLALLHPDDLSPAERAAQEAHIASCPACSFVSAQYAEIAALLRELPASDVPEEVPPRLVGLWEEEDKRQQAPSPLLISTQRARPKRNRRAPLVAALAAVLVAAVVLGSTIAHLVSVQPGNQVNPGGPGSSAGGAAVIFGRFFSIHQSTIYVESGSGKLLALRSDNGALIRSYTVGVGRLLDAPVVVGNVMYASDNNHTIYALRVDDGSILWRHVFSNSNNVSISRPLVSDGVVYTSTSTLDDQVYALRASDGTVLWRYKGQGVDEELWVAAVANGVAYLGSFEDGSVQHIYARNAKNGALLWSRRFQERNGPELVVNDGVIYASAGNALFALRANNGAVLWTHRIDNTRSLKSSNIAGGFRYTLGDNGYVYAIRIKDGRLQWSSKIAKYAEAVSPLIFMNGMIFVASFGGLNIAGNNPKTAGGNVYALRADNGRIIWQKNFGFNDIPIMAVDNGIVYVTSGVPPNDTLYALRPGDGSTLWSKSLNRL
jgi:outer membrane protein assembly factor BamB